MNETAFYETQDERSRAKTKIVSHYFSAWSRIVLSAAEKWNQNVGFVDLFSGPGKFEDGSESTPLLVLREAAENDRLAPRFESHFNDKNPTNVAKLRQHIMEAPELRNLHNAPIVTDHDVTSELIPAIERAGEIPTLFFVDPWGYKGLSIELLESALRGWGCDVIFFFNYNRINPGIANSIVDPLIDDLFGAHRAEILRKKLDGRSGHDREMVIVNEMVEAVRDSGAEYVLPFKFRSRLGERTSHYLIFATKHFLGFDVMKSVMAGVGSASSGDMPRFEFHESQSIQQLGLLDDFLGNQKLERLEEWLLRHFEDQELTVRETYEGHEIARRGTAFQKSEYRDALSRLELSERVTIDPPREERRRRKGKITLPDRAKVTFPRRS